MRNHIWMLGLNAILLTIAMALSLAGAAGTQPSWGWVTVEQGMLSGEVRQAPATELLLAIGQQAGIAVRFQVQPSTLLTMTWQGIPLDQALRQIMQQASVNYAVVYGADGQGQTVVREVHVMGRAPEGSGTTGAADSDNRPMAQRVPEGSGTTGAADSDARPMAQRVLEAWRATEETGAIGEGPAADIVRELKQKQLEQQETLQRMQEAVRDKFRLPK